MIDVDTNTILYESVMNKLFESCIVSPSDNLRKAYEGINPCPSKSFSLIKSLPRKEIEGKKKALHTLEKIEEEKRKNVDDYQ